MPPSPATIDPAGVIQQLELHSNTFMRDYVPMVFEQTTRHGESTKFIDLSERVMDGNHLEYEVHRHPNRGTIMTTDPHADAPDHLPGRYGRFVLKFDQTPGGASNDFGHLMTGLSKTFYTDKKDSDSNWKPDASMLTRDFLEMTQDVQENFARAFHIPTSGLIGTIATGGKKNDDSFAWDDASTYTAGSETAKLLLDNTPMSLLPVGQRIEIRQSNGTLRVNNVRITDNRNHEYTVDIQLSDESVDNTGSTVSNLNDVAATDRIYYQGGFNQNDTMNLQDFFDETKDYFRKEDGTALDRTDPENKWAMPRIFNAAAGSGQSAVDLTPRMVHTAGRMLAFQEGDANEETPVISIMNDDGYNHLTRLDKDRLVKIMHTDETEVGRRINERFGFNGFTWHTANIGTIPAVVDDFAAYGKMTFLNRGDWEIATPISGGFQMAPGPIAGMWNVVSNTTTGRPTLTYYARGVMAFAFVCTRPGRQVQIQNLNTNA